MKYSLFFCLLIVYLLTPSSWSFADTLLVDPSKESRATHLFKTIRCQVCQGESIDDSKADLAKDMRQLIRNQINQGRTDQEIKKFLSERYGQSILMETPFISITWIIWLAPLLMLLLGIFMIVRTQQKSSY